MRTKSKVNRNCSSKSTVVKKECMAPERFSRRIRHLPPIPELSLETIIKQIKKERRDDEKRVLTAKSTLTTTFYRRNKKLKYPKDTVDSKEIISILSAPKCRMQKMSDSKRGSFVKREPETTFEVQMRGSSATPRMVLRNNREPVYKTHTRLKHSSIKPKRMSTGGITNCMLERRKSFVLHVLNRGSLRDIRKLHTVGSKTAERILLYRQVKGSFSHISELANMPDFHLKKYRKFLTQNFLHT